MYASLGVRVNVVNARSGPEGGHLGVPFSYSRFTVGQSSLPAIIPVSLLVMKGPAVGPGAGERRRIEG